MNTFSEEHMAWKSLIADAFKPKTFKMWRQLVLNILVVDSGFKPGFLWDYSTLPLSRLEQLLTNAMDKGLLVNSLVVVAIEDDMMILNLQSLRDRSIPVYRLKAVDVGWSNKEPKEVTDCTSIEPTILAYRDIVERRRSEVTVCKENMFNPTTLFGLLLGYPVVYWYPMESNETMNCLGHEPLRVYKVVGLLKGKIVDGEKPFVHTVYSFSIPDCIVSCNHDNSTLVSEWYRQIYESGTWNSIFSWVKIVEEHVTLASVCL